MFSRYQIEAAIINLQRGESVDEANDVINRWCKDRRSIKEAIDIITTSGDENVVFAACPIARRNINQNWTKYSESDREEIRSLLEERLVSFTGSDVILSQIISVIVAIALKDWPDTWKTCVHDFIHSATNSQEMCILDMKILSELIVTIHETKDITNFTRRRLIKEFDKSSTEIMQMIDWSLENVGFDNICSPVIKLLKELCLTAPYENVIEPFMSSMLPALFNTFATNELCYQDAMTTIKNLLIERSDAKEIATQLFTETIQLFAGFCSSEEEVPYHILIFMMEYLTAYGPDIDEVCFEGEDIIEETSDLVRLLYSTIAKNPPVDDHCEEYWALWRSVLYRYSRSSNSNNPFEALKPCLQLFSPLIPLIRESLYNGFASAAEDGKLRSVDSQACWIFITSADRSGMIEFLQAQEPSPSLCYAIGLVDACLSGREERDMVTKIFPALFEFNQKKENIEFGISLLYALSHVIRFMNKEFSFLTAFGQCLNNFLRSDDSSVRSAAVNAVFYISMRQPRLLLLNEKVIVEEDEESENGETKTRIKIEEDDENEGSIIYGVYGIVYDLSDWAVKNSTKILKSVSLVASSRPNQESRARIYEYVTSSILSLFKTGDKDSIQNALLIVNSLTKLKLKDGSMLFLPLYEQMIDILQVAAEENRETDVSKIIDAITSTLLVDINSSVMTNVENFSSILVQLSDFRESALLAFSRLRSKYEVLETTFDQIYDALIKDIILHLADDEITSDTYPVLRFIRAFNIRKKLISLLLEIVVHFIKDERLDVSKEALKVLRKIIDFLCDEQENSGQDQSEGDEKVDLMMIVEPRMHFIDAIFTALTDTFHKPIFKQIAKAIQDLYRAMSVASVVVSAEQFDNDINVVLTKIIPNFTLPNEDFLINFSKALRTHSGDFDLFQSDLKEFLVTTNCASPSDKNLFRQELKLDTIEQELMNLVEDEEKNAIVAEELEILPALMNFKI